VTASETHGCRTEQFIFAISQRRRGKGSAKTRRMLVGCGYDKCAYSCPMWNQTHKENPKKINEIMNT
jgi:hypothetical protein